MNGAFPIDADDRIKNAKLAAAAVVPVSPPTRTPMDASHLTLPTQPLPQTITSAYSFIGSNGVETQKVESYSLEGEESLSISDGGRAALMAKLAKRAGMDDMMSNTSINPALAAGLPGATNAHVYSQVHNKANSQAHIPPPKPGVKGTPTNCLLIKNCFDKDKESGSEWHLDVQEDFGDECNKHGPVSCVRVEHTQPGGMVYVLFKTEEGAAKCAEVMNGRFFDMKQLECEFVENVFKT